MNVLLGRGLQTSPQHAVLVECGDAIPCARQDRLLAQGCPRRRTPIAWSTRCCPLVEANGSAGHDSDTKAICES